MSRPVLTRFDIFLYKPKNPPSDLSQVVTPGTVLFFCQGATASANVTIQAGGGTIPVQGVGAIQWDSTLLAGTSGTVPLTVTAMSGTSEITVTKPAGTADVVIPAGTRLFLRSSRPRIFSDPLGTIPLGSAVQADASGRVEVYVAERRFDYIAVDAAFGLTSSATVPGATTLNWFHGDPGGAGKYAIIAISWTGQSGTGNPPYVTYGGIAMTLVASTAANAIYALASPPASSQVIATFDDVVAAVGGGVTVLAGDMASALKWGTNYGASASASLTIASPYLWGLLIDCLSLPQLPLGSSLTPGAGDEQWTRWTTGVELPNFFQVHGAGSTKIATPGDAATSWSQLGGHAWNLVGLELNAPVLGSSIDVIGGTMPSPSWLDVNNFKSLYDAVAALPENGGTIFLSSATRHFLDQGTLLITKPNVTLQGQGKESTLIQTTAKNPTYDLITVIAPNFRMLDLQVFGNADPDVDPEEPPPQWKSCVVLSGPTASGFVLQNVILKKAGLHGLVLDDVGSVLGLHFEVSECLCHGVVVKGTSAPPRRIRFVGAGINLNEGAGIVIEAKGVVPTLGNVLLYGCGIEGNRSTGAEGYVVIRRLGGVQMIACYLELPATQTTPPKQFIYAKDTSRVLVSGCIFGQGGGAGTSVDHALKCETSRQVSFVNNGAFGLTTGKAMADFATCEDIVEYGNWNEDPAEVTRITGAGFGLSRKSVSLPAHGATAMGRGALTWDATYGNVRVFDGSAWRHVTYA